MKPDISCDEKIDEKMVRAIQLSSLHLADEMMAGLYRSGFKGKGMEFEEVRDYQPGDEMRHIDWNVTARRHKLYTKMFREERALTLWLLVDLSASMLCPSTPKRRCTAALASLLAFSAVRNGDAVGLILFSDTVEAILTSGKGSSQAMRITELILKHCLKSSGSNPLPALDRLLQIQKHRAICFLLSDFLTCYESPLWQRTAKHHDLIGVRIITPQEENNCTDSVITAIDSETGDLCSFDNRLTNPFLTYHREWEKAKAILIKSQLQLVDIHTHKPLASQLKIFFHQQAKRQLKAPSFH